MIAEPSVVFSHKGKEYRVTIDMLSIAQFESWADTSVLEFISVLGNVGNGGKIPKLSTLGHFVRAALDRHHHGLTFEEAMQLAMPAFNAGIFKRAIEVCFPEAQESKGKSDDPLAKTDPEIGISEN